ncbi:MAG: hypothetical protein QM831_16675 [Kofleriaceae bacterium]
MQFPLTDQLIDEARRFNLKSACGDCFYFRRGECAHGWPDEGQRRQPIDAADPVTGERPTTAAFCKEFELR